MRIRWAWASALALCVCPALAQAAGLSMMAGSATAQPANPVVPSPNEAYARLVFRYAAGEHEAAVAEARRLTAPELRRRLAGLLRLRNKADGEDNSSWFDDRVVKRMAEESNVLVHVVGIVPKPDDPGIAPDALLEPEHVGRLRQIAEVTGGRFWKADSPAHLAEAFQAVLEAMKMRYILRYEPTATPKAGFHRLEIKLRGAKGTVHARTGYFVSSARR
jgi:hypothetical protein